MVEHNSQRNNGKDGVDINDCSLPKYVFYNVDDVVGMLGVSRAKAYAIMKKLNDELKEQGFIVVAGKVSAKYFDEKLYLGI